MGKRIAIVQSNYVPWKGYFDLINSVDEFVLLDEVQYTRRDWRNRNVIKTHHGPKWLTIPVEVKSREQTIAETVIADPSWAQTHWQSLVHSYGRAPCFRAYQEIVGDLYSRTDEPYLSRINERFLRALCDLLGIRTPLVQSSSFALAGDKTERLVGICQQAGADEYLSGPAARDYLDEDCFRRAGVKLAYMDYADYPEYPQLHPPFNHFVSILDLIFNVGPDAGRYLKSSARLVPPSPRDVVGVCHA